MIKTSKKILCALLVAIMVVMSVPVSTFTELSLTTYAATDIKKKNACGDNAYFTYDSKKRELRFNGTGAVWSTFSTLDRAGLGIAEYIVISKGITDVEGFIKNNEMEAIKITVDKNNKCYSSDSRGALFNKDKTELIFYPNRNKSASYTVPKTVKKIRTDAFKGCSEKLKSVTISEGVTTIEKRAFYTCFGLTSVKIPSSVTSIGTTPFVSCRALKKITVDKNNKSYSSDSNGVLFNKKKTTLIVYPEGNTATAYTVPNSVKTIKDSAFYECGNLQSVNLGVGVKKIGRGAFYDCENLKTVTLPEGLTTIGNGAFSGCEKLKSITLPSKLTTIGDAAFASCKKIKSIKIPANVSAIGSNVFWDCENLKRITVDENNEYYSNDSTGVLFNKDKTELIKYPSNNEEYSYEIPNTTKTISTDGFGNCSKLESITIGNGVTTIGDSAFTGCTSLDKIVIPDSVTAIGEYAFSGCTSLNKIAIPDSVTAMGGYAFRDCVNLQSVSIGNGITAIGDSTFSDCASLNKIVIPDSVTAIGRYAFSDCKNLQSVSIGKNVTSIGEFAFELCGLKKISIPKNVKSIGRLAFNNCVRLTKITVDENNKNFSSDSYGVLFNKVKTVLIKYPMGNTRTTYTVPSPVKKISEFAFSDCKALKSVTIAKTVKTICCNAFEECSKLSKITVKGTFTKVEDRAFESTAYFENEHNWEKGALYLGGSLISVKEDVSSFTMKKGTVSIANGAFDFCSNLKKLTIVDSVKTIGDNAFAWCYNLKSVTIGKGVTTIGRYAFIFCGALDDIYYNGTKKDWNKIKIHKDNDELFMATIHYKA